MACVRVREEQIIQQCRARALGSPRFRGEKFGDHLDVVIETSRAWLVASGWAGHDNALSWWWVIAHPTNDNNVYT